MKNKGFLQISFQWLFAIVVGIVILFLTIYGVSRLIGLGQRTQEIETSKELGILLNPLETGFEEAKSSIIELRVDTRLYASCDDFGDFGKQGISVSQKSFGKWPESSEEVVFYNKYIFSEYPLETRKIYLFSKPFDFPFKVANLIYMTSADKTYCFKGAPEDIQDEIDNLGMENILIDECLSNSISVCFESETDCDIVVNYLNKYVDKEDSRVYFEGDALMYAAIFSEDAIYECQVKRLMKRVANLAELYKDKADLVALEGCSTNLNPDLQVLISMAQGLDDSYYLFNIKEHIEELNMKNKNNARCRLW
jgi:hypothetical protein